MDALFPPGVQSNCRCTACAVTGKEYPSDALAIRLPPSISGDVDRKDAGDERAVVVSSAIRPPPKTLVELHPCVRLLSSKSAQKLCPTCRAQNGPSASGEVAASRSCPSA